MHLHYAHQGPAQGEKAKGVVIILHGLLGSGQNWQSFARHLSVRYHVYALDLRNHGRSFHSSVHTVSAMVEDVLVFMDTKNFSSAHILGHSMGAKVAMRLALSDGSRVASLIIADMGLRRYNFSHKGLFSGMEGTKLGDIGNRKALSEALKASILGQGYRLDERTLPFLLQNAMTKASGRGFAWRVNMGVLSRSLQEIEAPISLDGRYDGPVFLLYGKQSSYVKDVDIEEMRKIFSNFSYKGLSAGHWLHAEVPSLFLAEVEAFLARNE